MSRTQAIIDAAAAMVHIHAVAGTDVPIAEAAESEHAIVDQLERLWHVDRRLMEEQRIAQKRVDYLKHNRHRVRQGALSLVFAFEQLTGECEVVTPTLRATAKINADETFRIKWSQR